MNHGNSGSLTEPRLSGEVIELAVLNVIEDNVSNFKTVWLFLMEAAMKWCLKAVGL